MSYHSCTFQLLTTIIFDHFRPFEMLKKEFSKKRKRPFWGQLSYLVVCFTVPYLVIKVCQIGSLAEDSSLFCENSSCNSWLFVYSFELIFLKLVYNVKKANNDLKITKLPWLLQTNQLKLFLIFFILTVLFSKVFGIHPIILFK